VWDCVHLACRPSCGLQYQLRMADDRWWNENWQEKLKYLEKTSHSAALSTTNGTWLEQGSNLDSRGWNRATKCLNYGTALTIKATCEVRLEDLTTSNTESTTFLYVTPWSLVGVYRRFRGTCCLHLKGRRVRWARKQKETNNHTCILRFPPRLHKWSQSVLPQRR
jgi:hypothetical protein